MGSTHSKGTQELENFISPNYQPYLQGSLESLCQEIEYKEGAFNWLESQLLNIRDQYPNQYIVVLFLKEEFEKLKHTSDYFKSRLDRAHQKVTYWIHLLKNRHV